MKIITIGGATQDAIIQYSPQEMLQLHTARGKQAFLIVEEGKKIEVNELAYHTGGGATNSAVSFKRLGFSVDIFCKIGTDFQADFVLKKLEQEEINTKLIKKTDKQATGTSFIIPSLGGDRSIFAFRGANTLMQENEIPTEEIKQAGWLYITSLSGDSSQLLLPITELAKKHNIPVANNPGVSQLAAGARTLCKSLKNIDILILNAQEANEFMQSLVQTDEQLKNKISQSCAAPGEERAPELISSPICYQDIQFNIRDFFQEVLKRGPKTVVVTNGAEGVYAASEGNIYFHSALQPATIVNTLGAGDAFGSCFVAQIAQGKSVEEALTMGIVNAASAIAHLDAKSGLLTAQELEKQAEEHPKGLCQQFGL
ncbi:carbohydrate kinase family protein [Candidatus Dependentiae bacterium]